MERIERAGWQLRRISRWLALGFVIALVTASKGSTQGGKTCATPVAATDAKFAPGQVWTFKSRDFELNPTITILRIESWGKVGEIIHVRIDGIRLRNCRGGPEPNSIAHAPFARDAIERSAGTLLRTGDVPSYAEGYKDWLSHCGGVYTILVGEVVEVDEKTFNSQSGCSL